MRLAILGLGLIGGSVARALRTRARSDWSLVAWTPNGNGPRAAGRAGVVDAVAPSLAAAVEDADVVLLAAPPLASIGLIDDLRQVALAGDCVVTDTASTKRAIVARGEAAGLRFVGGHPMAGRETSGFSAADPDLFVDRPWVICRGTSDDVAVERVEMLARAVGAVPVHMTAAAHDRAVAAVSHLPLLTSAALVEAVLSRGDATERDEAWRLAATGWRDATRLARGDAAMGAGIVATNADFIAARLRSLRDVIDSWLADVEGVGTPDPARLEARLAAARQLLDDDATPKPNG
jgi:prephenate dehydrogenase